MSLPTDYESNGTVPVRTSHGRAITSPGAYFDWRGICTAVRQPWRRIPQQLVSAMSEKSERAGARQFVRKLR